MRRPYRYHGLLICLCGLMLLGGCNQYGARPEITASADAPAANVSQPTGLRAQFDIASVVDELAGPSSPYCPIKNCPAIAIPLTAALGTPIPLSELGIPGVCVVAASQPEAAAVLHKSEPTSKATGYLP